jgi:hypothetical protein
MGRSQRVKGATFERDIANALGAKRNIGQARDGGDDITLGRFRIECKRRKRLGTVQAWLAQAQAACAQAGDVPVVVAREDHGEALVIMRFADALPLLTQGQVDAARSASHTASYATPMGRPREFRPAPARGLQREGGVRRGAAAPEQPADATASGPPQRRRRRRPAPERGAECADTGSQARETSPFGALFPPSEAAVDSVRE